MTLLLKKKSKCAEKMNGAKSATHSIAGYRQALHLYMRVLSKETTFVTLNLFFCSPTFYFILPSYCTANHQKHTRGNLSSRKSFL